MIQEYHSNRPLHAMSEYPESIESWVFCQEQTGETWVQKLCQYGGALTPVIFMFFCSDLPFNRLHTETVTECY
ncbi:hypothetical protein P5673_018353 [Acropora cervicornis]|uniref:Uncharacterized protein n=1 Tax=Acropora cervicornis TaxID=6130 RepID=A0AAD9QDH7_ACRCE|nr:hypothetical protein P5673_018353 [Acropora cervicornis]